MRCNACKEAPSQLKRRYSNTNNNFFEHFKHLRHTFAMRRETTRA